MRTTLVLAVAALLSLTARSAEACSCAAVEAEEAWDRAQVVADGVVTVIPGRFRATFLVTTARKGAKAGEVLEFEWGGMQGTSCARRSLADGAWQLYLSAAKDGGLVLGICDQHSRKLPEPPAGAGPSSEPSPRPRPVVPGAPADDAGYEAREAARLVLDAACKAGNKALYDQWPAERRGSLERFDLLKPKDLTLRLQSGGGWRFRWARWPLGAVQWEVDVTVGPDGSTTVTKAVLDHPG